MQQALPKGPEKSISEQFTLQCELKSVVDNYTGKLDVSSEALVEMTPPWTMKVTIYSDNSVVIASSRTFTYYGNATGSLIEAISASVAGGDYIVGNKISINRYEGTFKLLSLNVDTKKPTQLISSTRHGLCKSVRRLF